MLRITGIEYAAPKFSQTHAGPRIRANRRAELLSDPLRRVAVKILTMSIREPQS